MIRILVTGGNGQLGSEFRTLAPSYPHFDLYFTDLPELDITDKKAVEALFRLKSYDVVINCAAYTAVDKAEEEPEVAMKVNRDAVASLAGWCRKKNAYMIHISTDYVFDGTTGRPYREEDPVNPMSSYGRSKLAGEEAMGTCLSQGMIIRTSWLYSSFGNNFVKTIFRKAKETGSLSVVSDQHGNPTYARDLAKVILDILPAALSMPQFQVLHFSDEGICSWYELASEIVKIAGIPCVIKPIATDEYPALAPRPHYSALDKSKIKQKFGISVPFWRDSLRECVSLMVHDSGE